MFESTAIMDGVIKEIRDDESATVVVLNGEVTLDKAPSLHERLKGLCRQGTHNLIIELTEVAHIDSAGVGTLVDIFRRVRTQGGKMALVGMNPRVRGVFEVTKLDQFFAIFDTEEEALRP